MQAKFAAVLVLAYCKHLFPEDVDGMAKVAVSRIVPELRDNTSNGSHKYIPTERLNAALGLKDGEGVFSYYGFEDGSRLLVTCSDGLATWSGDKEEAPQFYRLPPCK